MWLSFYSNVLIFVVGAAVYFMHKPKLAHDFAWFLTTTAVSALIGAFGHLEILPLQTQAILLFCSRVINLISFYYFGRGTLHHFGWLDSGQIKHGHNAILVLASVWLVYLNVLYPGTKLGFRPVMTYGIIEMLLISGFLFVKHVKQNTAAHKNILIGIGIILVSAVIFKAMPQGLGLKPSNISHVLVALSLVVLSKGFVKLK